MKKKGVSTLITTILIISLVFVLASLLTLFGVSFTKKQTADVEKEFASELGLLGTVNLKLKNFQILPNNNAKMTIENQGKKDVEKVHVRFFNNDGRIDTRLTTSGITAYSIKDFVVAYDNSFNKIVKVEIFPQVIVNGQNISLPSLFDSKKVAELKSCTTSLECDNEDICCSGSCLNAQCSSNSKCVGGACQFVEDPCLSYCTNYGTGSGDGGAGSNENPTSCIDSDADAYDTCDPDMDCNDNEAAINPEALEVCDGVDNNCDGFLDGTDNDGDTYNSSVVSCGPVDCNDSDATINPGASETCDGLDNNCDGSVDENNVCGGGGGGGGGEPIGGKKLKLL